MVVVALRGPRIRTPPNVIATLIRRHFNGLRGPPVVGTPNATHEGIHSAELVCAIYPAHMSDVIFHYSGDRNLFFMDSTTRGVISKNNIDGPLGGTAAPVGR
jgi:hypothetical protein